MLLLRISSSILFVFRVNPMVNRCLSHSFDRFTWPDQISEAPWSDTVSPGVPRKFTSPTLGRRHLRSPGKPHAKSGDNASMIPGGVWATELRVLSIAHVRPNW